MKPAEDVAATPNSDDPRRAWTAPKARRLAISAAEAGGVVSIDGIEIVS